MSGSRVQEDGAYFAQANTAKAAQAERIGCKSDMSGGSPPRVSPGTRRTAVELSVSDLRELVGAPMWAEVAVVPERDHGPNGTDPLRVTVSWSWKEGA